MAQQDSAGDGAVIINHGRCGSTLLSNLLGEHPQVLSVQEYMISLGSLAYTAPGALTGAEFWELVSGPSTIEALVRRLDRIPAELIYRGAIRASRGGRTAMPRILGVALAALDPDPDQLFGDLAGQVPAFPTQGLGAHHRQLFAVLMNRYGRSMWVERSGGNCGYADRLVSMFPGARVIYLSRDCADTVLSMCRHPYFQLATMGEQFERLCALNPFDEDAAGVGDGIPTELRALLPQNLTGGQLDRRGELLEPFVLRWVMQDLHAQAVLSALPPQQQLEVSYESLLADPTGELARIAEFLGLRKVPAWASDAARRVVTPARRGTPEIRRHIAAWQATITESFLATGTYSPSTVA